MVLEVRDVLVEGRDVEVLSDLRARVHQVAAEPLQLLFVLSLCDRLRLAAATCRDECRANGNHDERPEHSGGYATRALAGDAQLGNRAGTRTPPRARDARHDAALDEPRHLAA